MALVQSIVSRMPSIEYAVPEGNQAKLLSRASCALGPVTKQLDLCGPGQSLWEGEAPMGFKSWMNSGVDDRVAAKGSTGARVLLRLGMFFSVGS